MSSRRLSTLSRPGKPAWHSACTMCSELLPGSEEVGVALDMQDGILQDRIASRDGWIRVIIDECDEDYLYPASWFVPVRPAKASERRLASALRNASSVQS